ncbi:hypothetical protein BRE01_62260 [Brevibacillus reuszeri]|uniref:Uncharacterized protein n=1 Tax=Brevibacillus reuszeri TaxID=54915 RepID=A0A0K9YW69_9BACL|nr:hypothetical protein [Brevibacillus reuszeri]KNB72923.1 hypothetical protein ADS79_13940 [Brevibacillus reuszeri]GED72524.1 hypothetical protein BRE01_62260 [Brevibacillus reuszeri]
MNQFTGFHFDKCPCEPCCNDTETISINLREAEDIVSEFFSKFVNATSEQQLHTLLLEFYDVAGDNEVKHYIDEDIARKMGDLYEIEVGILDEDGDLANCCSQCHCK